MPEAEDHRNTREGLCVACRELKPASLFRKNAAGALTAWCESCRMEKAKKWKIEEDHVELAHALFVLEEGFKSEALMAARVTGHAAEVALAQGLRIYELNRTLRIPHTLRRLIKDARNHFYAVVGMVAPSLPEFAGVEA